MMELERLFERILQRLQVNLREADFDVRAAVARLLPLEQLTKFYAFYGITPHHPLDLQFRHCSLSGSYFLGKCRATNAILYKCDVRGDELKRRGEVFAFEGFQIPVTRDEGIQVEDSFLVKTLVHNYSHDPESLENFFIRDTVAGHYSNIHGAPVDGCFLGPLATVDLTTVRDCVVGAFCYVQAGEIGHLKIDPGTVWVHSPRKFNFLYRHPPRELARYLRFAPGGPPAGIIMDFIEERKEAFQEVFNVVNIDPSVPVPPSASLDRYAVVRPSTRIGENVLVCQRAFLHNAWLGEGANAQEHCYIVNARLEGFNVTAHGAKLIEADLGRNVFVGFNSFLRGRPGSRLTVGEGSIVMPHTIIDADDPLAIPAERLVWGLIRNAADLAQNSMALSDFARIEGGLVKGGLFFEGSGAAFVEAFRARIHHILEANGAFFDGSAHRGHAQRNRRISFNTLQPYPDGDLKGMYPTVVIRP